MNACAHPLARSDAARQVSHSDFNTASFKVRLPPHHVAAFTRRSGVWLGDEYLSRWRGRAEHHLRQRGCSESSATTPTGRQPDIRSRRFRQTDSRMSTTRSARLVPTTGSPGTPALPSKKSIQVTAPIRAVAHGLFNQITRLKQKHSASEIPHLGRRMDRFRAVLRNGRGGREPADLRAVLRRLPEDVSAVRRHRHRLGTSRVRRIATRQPA